MAYQPKFAKDNKKQKKPEIIREDRTIAQTKTESYAAPKKRSKVGMVLFVLLGCIVVPASCFATWLLMENMIAMVGRPGNAAQAKTADMSIMERFDAYMQNQMADVEAAILAVDKPDAPQQEEEKPVVVEPVRKRYWIEEGTLVPPEPNQECYGESTDVLELMEVLQKAEWMVVLCLQ